MTFGILSDYERSDEMPELRIIVSGKIEEMINKLIDENIFEKKTEVVRVALLEYFHNHNWFKDIL